MQLCLGRRLAISLCFGTPLYRIHQVVQIRQYVVTRELEASNLQGKLNRIHSSWTSMISTESTAFAGKRRRSARLAASQPRSMSNPDPSALTSASRECNSNTTAQCKEDTRQPSSPVTVAEAVVSPLSPASTEQLRTSSKGPTRRLEEGLREKGFQRAAGIDEAGRGPLAGPVVAAACHIPLDLTIPGVNDSKKLSAKRREELFELLMNEPRVSCSTCVIEPNVIDEVNIFQATMLAMRGAAAQLQPQADFHLVDGPHLPKGVDTGTWKAVVGGDHRCCVIAAASIIAKVTRDRLMLRYHEQYPQYGFAEHKGYGTKKHMAALREHGPCPIHRRSFEPIKSDARK